MIKSYEPKVPFTVTAQLLIPTETKAKGVVKKTYPESGELINISFRSFGGTEKVVNDVIVIEDTAVIETWYRPDIKADCRLLIETIPYEILGRPENIDMRNQYLKIRVRAIEGGA